MSEEQATSRGTAYSSEEASAEVADVAASNDPATATAETLAATEALIPTEEGGAAPAPEARVFDAPALAQMIESGDGISPEAMDYSSALLQDRLGLSDDEARGILFALAEGTNARNTLAENELFGTVGGKEAFGELQTWAADNLSETEIEEFNSNLANAASIEDQKSALQHLQGLREERQGVAPNRVAGEVSPEPAVKPIKSRAELVQLMSDPRYDKDPVFREAVDRRLEAGLGSDSYKTWNRTI